MIVYGIDLPLVEVVFILTVITFLLLLEGIFLIAFVVKTLDKARQMGNLMEKLSEALLAIKKAELEELNHIKKR